MAPKNKFTKEQIIEAGFEIAKEDGMDGITIRKVAERLGSSIAPIYVNFNDVDELKEAVMTKIYAMGKEMVFEINTGNPFHDIGIASLKFAREYSVLFKDMMLKNNTYMKNYDDQMGDVLIEEMKKDPDLTGFTDEELKTILLKMRVFQLGLSVMAANAILPESFSEYEMIALLESTATDIIFSSKHKKS